MIITDYIIFQSQKTKKVFFILFSPKLKFRIRSVTFLFERSNLTNFSQFPTVRRLTGEKNRWKIHRPDNLKYFCNTDVYYYLENFGWDLSRGIRRLTIYIAVLLNTETGATLQRQQSQGAFGSNSESRRASRRVRSWRVSKANYHHETRCSSRRTFVAALRHSRDPESGM